MAFKELEHRGQWLRLQTAAWLVPRALLPVAFGTYLGSWYLGARGPFFLVVLLGYWPLSKGAKFGDGMAIQIIKE